MKTDCKLHPCASCDGGGGIKFCTTPRDNYGFCHIDESDADDPTNIATSTTVAVNDDNITTMKRAIAVIDEYRHCAKTTPLPVLAACHVCDAVHIATRVHTQYIAITDKDREFFNDIKAGAFPFSIAENAKWNDMNWVSSISHMLRIRSMLVRAVIMRHYLLQQTRRTDHCDDDAPFGGHTITRPMPLTQRPLAASVVDTEENDRRRHELLRHCIKTLNSFLVACRDIAEFPASMVRDMQLALEVVDDVCTSQFDVDGGGSSSIATADELCMWKRMLKVLASAPAQRASHIHRFHCNDLHRMRAAMYCVLHTKCCSGGGGGGGGGGGMQDLIGVGGAEKGQHCDDSGGRSSSSSTAAAAATTTNSAPKIWGLKDGNFNMDGGQKTTTATTSSPQQQQQQQQPQVVAAVATAVTDAAWESCATTSELVAHNTRFRSLGDGVDHLGRDPNRDDIWTLTMAGNHVARTDIVHQDLCMPATVVVPSGFPMEWVNRRSVAPLPTLPLYRGLMRHRFGSQLDRFLQSSNQALQAIGGGHVFVAGGAAMQPIVEYTYGIPQTSDDYVNHADALQHMICSDIDVFLHVPAAAATPTSERNLWTALSAVRKSLLEAYGGSDRPPVTPLISESIKRGIYQCRLSVAGSYASAAADGGEEKQQQQPPPVVMKFQVMLRTFPSMSALLHGFDLPCCAVAYDGAECYMTSMAVHSHLTRTNIVVPEYRSPSYEFRLCKYAMRGYAIGLQQPLMHRTFRVAAAVATKSATKAAAAAAPALIITSERAQELVDIGIECDDKSSLRLGLHHGGTIPAHLDTEAKREQENHHRLSQHLSDLEWERQLELKRVAAAAASDTQPEKSKKKKKQPKSPIRVELKHMTLHHVRPIDNINTTADAAADAANVSTAQQKQQHRRYGNYQPWFAVRAEIDIHVSDRALFLSGIRNNNNNKKSSPPSSAAAAAAAAKEDATDERVNRFSDYDALANSERVVDNNELDCDTARRSNIKTLMTWMSHEMRQQQQQSLKWVWTMHPSSSNGLGSALERTISADCWAAAVSVYDLFLQTDDAAETPTLMREDEDAGAAGDSNKFKILSLSGALTFMRSHLLMSNAAIRTVMLEQTLLKDDAGAVLDLLMMHRQYNIDDKKQSARRRYAVHLPMEWIRQKRRSANQRMIDVARRTQVEFWIRHPNRDSVEAEAFTASLSPMAESAAEWYNHAMGDAAADANPTNVVNRQLQQRQQGNSDPCLDCGWAHNCAQRWRRFVSANTVTGDTTGGVVTSSGSWCDGCTRLRYSAANDDVAEVVCAPKMPTVEFHQCYASQFYIGQSGTCSSGIGLALYPQHVQSIRREKSAAASAAAAAICEIRVVE